MGRMFDTGCIGALRGNSGRDGNSADSLFGVGLLTTGTWITETLPVAAASAMISSIDMASVDFAATVTGLGGPTGRSSTTAWSVASLSDDLGSSGLVSVGGAATGFGSGARGASVPSRPSVITASLA